MIEVTQRSARDDGRCGACASELDSSTGRLKPPAEDLVFEVVVGTGVGVAMCMRVCRRHAAALISTLAASLAAAPLPTKEPKP